MTIEVVNLKTCKDFGKREGDVYIGRSTGKWVGSPWGNPYRMYNESQRESVIALYRGWVLQGLQSGRLNLASLKGAQRLGCWCAPKHCHGDVLKDLLERNV
jgi:hypothetical protein